jgi:hypothetical protein
MMISFLCRGCKQIRIRQYAGATIESTDRKPRVAIPKSKEKPDGNVQWNQLL